MYLQFLADVAWLLKKKKKSRPPQISPVTATSAALSEAYQMQSRLLVLDLTVMMQWLIERLDGLLVCLAWVGSQLLQEGRM